MSDSLQIAGNHRRVNGEPTMEDVARASGYSRAAVSLALRGDRTIPEETRKLITTVAGRLGYRTNPLVAALMSMQRQRRPAAQSITGIAYLTSHSRDNPWRKWRAFVTMFQGANKRASEFGFRIEELNLRVNGMTSQRMRNILESRNIHALVVAPLPRCERSIDFDFSSFVVVGVGLSVHEPSIERVANDHFQSAALAVDRCIDLGYRRLGLVLNREGSYRLDHRWLGGFQLAMAQHGNTVPVPPLMLEHGQDVATVLAWQQTHRPDVVILDSAEPELCAALPRTVGIVSLGVDSSDDAVTGIYQNYGLIGRVAVESVIGKLYTNSFGTSNEGRLHMISGSWVAGTTALGPGMARRER